MAQARTCEGIANLIAADPMRALDRLGMTGLLRATGPRRALVRCQADSIDAANGGRFNIPWPGD